ncbi:MAG: hypothetical protein RL186_822 [Pseudomonadota bacterium]|jgi:hypothetical protein
MSKRVSIVLLALVLAGCATTNVKPPANTADACAILAEKRGWESHVFEAARNWSVSPGTILSFIRHESGFRHNARPVDKGGKPLSSAYGYAQALDGTWAHYERVQGGGKRKSFEDSADFIGWYLDQISKQTKVQKSDARNLYLAYHEGPGGFNRGTYRAKTWLLGVAQRVDAQAQTYDNQLQRCERRKMRQWARN